MSFDGFRILAESDADATRISDFASLLGMRVIDSTVWEGPVPEGSYMQIDDFVRMSTPEFFLFRMICTHDAFDAVMYAREMLGTVVTSLTRPDLEDGECEVIDAPRTTAEAMLDYLLPLVGEGGESKALAERAILVVALAGLV